MANLNKGKNRKPRYKDREVERSSRDYRDNKSGSDTRLKATLADQMPKFNDYSWYSKNPLLVESAARIPFPYRPGDSIQSIWKGGGTEQHAGLPGIMTLSWIPSIGPAKMTSDPVNVAAKEIYARVRSQFVGNIDADPPDFMIYFICLDSIFSYIGYLKRLYRVLTKWDPDNRYMPEGLLQAMGLNSVDIATLMHEKTRLWGNINELVLMTRKFRCPDVFPLFSRHYWLNDNVYTDAATMNSQMYLFNQEMFYQFRTQKTPDNIDAGGAILDYNPIVSTHGDPSKVVDAAVLFDFGKQLINALAMSDDAYTISGYLLKAYDGAGEFFVDTLPEAEEFYAVYDEAVLSQIENSYTVFGYGYANFKTNAPFQAAEITAISQDPKTNRVLCALTGTTAQVTVKDLTTGVQLNLRKEIPSVEEVVEATRLITTVEFIGNDKIEIHAGSEILTGYTITARGSDGTVAALATVASMQPVTTTFKVDPGLLALWTHFDWSPALYFALFNQAPVNNSVPTTSCVFQEAHNVTYVDEGTLSRLNRVCLYSEFNAFAE